MGNIWKEKQASLTYYVIPDVCVWERKQSSAKNSVHVWADRLPACCPLLQRRVWVEEGRDCVVYCKPQAFTWALLARVYLLLLARRMTLLSYSFFLCSHLAIVLGPGTVTLTFFRETPILYLGGTLCPQHSYWGTMEARYVKIDRACHRISIVKQWEAGFRRK